MDKARCPLCGTANQCIIQSGGTGKCWCSEVDFSAELLARVPDDAKLKVCICRACAEAAATAAPAGERT